MKRFICVFLIFTFFSFPSFAEIDLSAMSYEELIALKDNVQLAIWQNQNWQEVEVPKGVYVVGKDIPVGKWTILAADESKCYIKWGDKLEISGVDLSFDGSIFVSEILYSPLYRNFEKDDPTQVTWNLREGDFFIVESGLAVFTPYSGVPSLGFK